MVFRRTLPAALLLMTAAALAQAPSNTSSNELDRLISEALERTGAPSASVAIAQNGSIVYAKAFGSATSTTDAKPETRYAVGSVSKQFTAAALLLAQEQGKLSLDDKVSKYFPELTRSNEITVRQLLTHTAGYEDFAPQDYLIPEWMQPTTAETIMHLWAEKKPLNFDPGTRWQYSNTNYVVAGRIFEKATGQGLVSFLTNQIFQPLGMTSAGDCDERGANDAAAFTRYALGPPRPVGREAKGWYFAAGELCMTASDVARWDIAFLDHKLLAAASYDQFTTEMKLKDGKSTHYALGLQLGELQGTPMIYHSGEVSGFLAINRVFPAKKLAVVVLSNEDGVNLIGPLSQDLALSALEPASGDVTKRDREVRQILEGLQKGVIDKSLFTADARSYFNDKALMDYKSSLAGLGQLQSVTRQSQSLRGGMTHLSYRAQFDRKSVVLNIYVTKDEKYEQFLVEEQL